MRAIKKINSARKSFLCLVQKPKKKNNVLKKNTIGHFIKLTVMQFCNVFLINIFVLENIG